MAAKNGLPQDMAWMPPGKDGGRAWHVCKETLGMWHAQTLGTGTHVYTSARTYNMQPSCANHAGLTARGGWLRRIWDGAAELALVICWLRRARGFVAAARGIGIAVHRDEDGRAAVVLAQLPVLARVLVFRGGASGGTVDVGAVHHTAVQIGEAHTHVHAMSATRYVAACTKCQRTCPPSVPARPTAHAYFTCIVSSSTARRATTQY